MTVSNDPAHLYCGGDPGVELIHRYGIVRLGVGGPELYYPTNHGSLGVTGVGIKGSYLMVYTDFGEDEVCVHASADADLTLASKGITAGVSGGGATSRIGIYSSRDLPYGVASVRKAGTMLPPNSAVFDIGVDNLWLHFASVRPLPIQ